MDPDDNQEIAEAVCIAREFLGREDTTAARMLCGIAALAGDHEALPARAPLRKETRKQLERAAALAEELAGILSAPPLDRLNGLNGFRAAAHAVTGGPIETVSPEALRASASGARLLLARIPGGQGSATISDALGNPRGRLICAVAAVKLLEDRTGRPPGKTNPVAQSFARCLWHLAGGSDSEAVNDGGDELAAWERHIRAARRQDRNVPDAVVEQAWKLVTCEVDARMAWDVKRSDLCD